ncbi:MAG: TetR/AcrR family transcriptional regulator [Dietzia psychralcaliphila]
MSDRSGGRHHELLASLERLVLSRGFAGLTVAEIARELHCSRRALYELEPSRDDLIARVVRRFFARTGHDAEIAITSASTRRGQALAYLSSQELARSSPRFQADLVEWPRSREILDFHTIAALNKLEALIQAGIDEREFRPVNARLIARACLAAMFTFRDPQVVDDVGMAYVEAMTELYVIIFDGIELRAP